MATKIKLGNRPKSFHRSVTVQLPGEEAGSINAEFIYRSRSEFAQLVDELNDELKAKAEKEAASLRAAIDKGEALPELTQEDITARQNALKTDHLLRILSGWDLDIEFSKDAVAQLVNELPGAASALIEEYRNAIVEGRLGN